MSLVCIAHPVYCTTYVLVQYIHMPGIGSNDSHRPLSALALACTQLYLPVSRQSRREDSPQIGMFPGIAKFESPHYF